MEYPMDHVLNALAQGAQIRNAMQGMALRERELDLDQQQQAFNQRIRDAEMSYNLLTNPNLRPVEGGTYAASMPSTSAVPSKAMDAISALRSGDTSRVATTTPAPVETRAPVRPGGTIDWKNQQYAALTPDEQLQQRIAVGRSEVMARAAAGDEVRQRFGVAPPAEVADLYPEGFKVTNEELARDVPVVMSTRRAINTEASRTAREEQRLREQQTFQREQGELNRENARTVAGIRTSREAKEPKTSREERADALTELVLKDSAEQGGKTIDDAAKNVKEFYKDDPRFARGARLQVIARLQRMAKESGKRNPFAKQAAAVPAAAGASGATNGGPQKGATRSYMGADYTFDGTQWVRN